MMRAGCGDAGISVSNIAPPVAVPVAIPVATAPAQAQLQAQVAPGPTVVARTKTILAPDAVPTAHAKPALAQLSNTGAVRIFVAGHLMARSRNEAGRIGASGGCARKRRAVAYGAAHRRFARLSRHKALCRFTAKGAGAA